MSANEGEGSNGGIIGVQSMNNGTNANTSSSTSPEGTGELSINSNAIKQSDDSSLMPPPTPGSIRSSGRQIKPSLKARELDMDDDYQDPSSNSNGRSLRIRPPSRPSGSGQISSSAIRAKRLRLNIRSEQRLRGRGDPTYAGANKTTPYMQGYDRELDSSDDETGDGMAFEEHILLRMPEGHEVTKMLGDWVRKREAGTEGHEIELKFKDARRAVFKVGEKMMSSKLVDLPAIIESHKTLDNKQLFKIADISQMLLVTHLIQEEADVAKPNPEPIEGLADDFVYDHGLTPPMRWARKRRFRKRIHKRTIETVEKEVERLLQEDERAEKVEFKMIDAAEADFSDSDDEARAARRRAARDGSMMDDGASTLADGEDRSIYDDFEEGSFAGDNEDDDDDVDQDLQRELEEEMLLQQQEDEEDEDEDEDDDDASSTGRRRRRARSSSRATSDDDDEDDDDDDDDDDLFDEGGTGDEAQAADPDATGLDGERDDDDDDDLDEEEAELRVREQQLEAECKEIEGMVKRKQAEVDATANALIKQRNSASLKRIRDELEIKRNQLQDLKQQRREGKEAARAEAEEAAAAAAASAAAAAAEENQKINSEQPENQQEKGKSSSNDESVVKSSSAARVNGNGDSNAKGSHKRVRTTTDTTTELEDTEARGGEEDYDVEEEDDEAGDDEDDDLF